MGQEKGSGSVVTTLQSLFRRSYDRSLNIFRYMSFGTSTGTNAVAFKVDADGHMQADILSGGGSGTQVSDAVLLTGAASGNIMVAQDTTGSAQFVQSDTGGKLNVNAAISSTTNVVGKMSAIFNANAKVSVIADLALAKAADNVTAVLSAGANIVGKASAFQIGTYDVSATNLDIRDLTKASDNVLASLSAGINAVGKMSAIFNSNTKVSVISDLALSKATDNVSVALSAGANIVGKASAFQIGTWTVDASNLDVRDLTKATDNVLASLSAGTNIVGKVSAFQNANTKVSVIADLALAKATDNVMASLSAGTNIVGKVSAFQIDTFENSETTGFTSIQIDADASGSAQVVAASAGKQITVYNIDMTVAASGNVAWKGGTAALVAAQYFPKNSGKEHNYHPGFMCKTASGSGLYINAGSAVSARGVIGITKL